MRIFKISSIILYAIVITSTCGYSQTTPNVWGQNNPFSTPAERRLMMKNNSYDFTIILKNDSAITAKAKIDLSKDGDFITIGKKASRVKIYPNDTKSISRKTRSGNVLTGFAADSCWYFKICSGAINGYSNFAEETTNYITAIQYGDGGKIIPLMAKNLIIIVGSRDRKITKMIADGDMRGAILVYNENVRISGPGEQRR